MRHTALILAAGLALVGVSPPAEARSVCPEGRRSDGACVNPRLAAVARQQAVCYSQVKLSFVACPGILPGADLLYKYPFNVVTERQRELNLLFGF